MRVMVDVLPSPFKGLLLAAFAAAYMSTISTHLNWGASYLVNDVYLRFLKPRRRPAGAGHRLPGRNRCADGALAGRHGFLTSVEQGWKLLIGARRGHRTGVHPSLVLVAGECLVGDQRDGRVVRHLGRSGHLCGYDLSRHRRPADYAMTMLITVLVTTVVWLAVTLLTPPESDATLEPVLPAGPARRPRLAAGVRAAGLRGRPDSGRGAVLGELGGRGGGGLLRGVRAGRIPDRLPALAGALYGAVAIAAFLLIQRNLRADPTLDTQR